MLHRMSLCVTDTYKKLRYLVSKAYKNNLSFGLSHILSHVKRFHAFRRSL
jgi:hypothetical protein